MPYRVHFAALATAITCGLFVAFACSNETRRQSLTPTTETATATATTRASPTATPPPTVATPVAALPPRDAYADAPPSGRADIDEVIRSVRGGDPQALLA